MTPLQRVREAVVRAVPEIMELKAGCRIEEYLGEGREYVIAATHGSCEKHKKCSNDKETCEYTSGVTAIYEGQLYDEFGYLQEEIKGDDIHDQKKWVILGRTIRLADVLLAIGEIQDSRYEIDATGRFSEADLPTGYSWNLSKDSLDDQSPETISFLDSILK